VNYHKSILNLSDCQYLFPYSTLLRNKFRIFSFGVFYFKINFFERKAFFISIKRRQLAIKKIKEKEKRKVPKEKFENKSAKILSAEFFCVFN